ncbi:hypothetical protein I316_04289 [Kwoniella heveanensis BCC8398]|uniref:Major facilitator superfamily (MFS) profile domain-containing protein n=1 Tax=Kwoniella heveanensis BCC8398 TaxID=1296120 RepID=A0A1B9GSE3_9TREE|nr:hypothetical protein I316_04289 [Kwoniella heveanensis BCC8398]
MREGFRDSFFGQQLRRVRRFRFLSYPEEQKGFKLPQKNQLETPAVLTISIGDHELSDVPPATPDEFLVDWNGPNDQDNPRNWSLVKKSSVTTSIMILTITVYIGSAIWTPGIEAGAEFFGVSTTASSLGISMFVVGYGIGPLFLCGITEIPFIGRTNPYIFSLAIFFILNILTAIVNNFAGFLVLRFLAGFWGSPALATGGASLDDMFVPHKVAYAMGLWELSAEAAPALAPIVASFAVQYEGWRWAFWEMSIMSGVCLSGLCIWLPETSPDTILLRRAQGLRLATGDHRYRSHSEVVQASMSTREIFTESLVRPLSMTFTEPIIIAINMYVGIIYAILYSFFESYPLVFQKGYGWSISKASLPFAALLLGSFFGGIVYWTWNWRTIDKPFSKAAPPAIPETRLPLSKYGAFCFPICILWFAWSSNRTHWIVPTLSGIPFTIGATLIFNPFLTYLPYAYPKYAASALASNDFFRSMLGAGMPVVAHPMFAKLGIAWGNTLLGLLTVLLIPIP